MRARASFVTAGSEQQQDGKRTLRQGAGLQGIASQLGVSSGGDPSESPNFYVSLIESDELKRRLLSSLFQDPRGKSPSDSATLLEIFRPRSNSPQRRIELGLKKLGQSISTDFDLKD